MRVLVVEDEVRMAALLKRGFEEDGYAVDAAATGPDAVWQAGESPTTPSCSTSMLPWPTASRCAVSCARRGGGRPSSCSPPATTSTTGSAGSTPAPTTT